MHCCIYIRRAKYVPGIWYSYYIVLKIDYDTCQAYGTYRVTEYIIYLVDNKEGSAARLTTKTT